MRNTSRFLTRLSQRSRWVFISLLLASCLA
ncbi:hypothetical protein MalM25_33230 [Planctomycetes bacterium MalM25]|nr:hypothetical protein MalM25_33230 [Planctomycetes bacterium MalM25]